MERSPTKLESLERHLRLREPTNMPSASKVLCVFCAFLIFVGFLLIAVDGEPNLIIFGQLTIGVGLLFLAAADLLDASRRTLAALLRFIN